MATKRDGARGASGRLKSVCVVTSARADYGILRPLIQKLSDDSELELRLAVTGTHLSKAYGYTVTEIEDDGVPIDRKIPILPVDEAKNAASRVMARALEGFAEYFSERRPDLLVVLGDRSEIAAVCFAAVNARVPIAHIHGGESTEGAIDECCRHAITKMSYLHFPACEAYRKRVIQLGEAPERVYNVGAMGVENALRLPKLTREELTRQVGFDFREPYAIATFHPVTLENGTELEQCEALFDALDRWPALGVLITKANADEGGHVINDAMDAYAGRRARCRAVFSLGALRYLSALRYAACVIGNSSSGLLEAPAFRVPTVNIGDRQKGRLRADSVIDCGVSADEIADAIGRALSPGFIASLPAARAPYGAGDASGRILSVIKACLLRGEINLKKPFYDIPFQADVGSEA